MYNPVNPDIMQALRRNFPNYSVGFQGNVPLGNRVAQADMIRDQLSVRQQALSLGELNAAGLGQSLGLFAQVLLGRINR